MTKIWTAKIISSKKKFFLQNELRSLENLDLPTKFPQKISAKIKNGFDFYFAANGFDCDANVDGVSKFMQEKILENISRNENGKFFISQSVMKNFFPCPRKWIFKNILSLKEDTLDTDIFERYDAGSINHKILELYLKQTARLPFTDEKTKRLFDEEKIREQIWKIVRNGAEEIFEEKEAKSFAVRAGKSLHAKFFGARNSSFANGNFRGNDNKFFAMVLPKKSLWRMASSRRGRKITNAIRAR